jgi:hypothetical protein
MDLTNTTTERADAINRQRPKEKTKRSFSQVYVRDLSEKVYRILIGNEGTRRMIEKDGDNGEKLRNRAALYDKLTRAYLRALNIKPEA